MEGRQTGTTTMGQGGTGSNGNEGVSLKALGLKPQHQIQFSVISRTFIGGGVPYSSVEMQLAYSTAPANWAGMF